MDSSCRQEFILFAETEMRARRIEGSPDVDQRAHWGPELSDFGYVISGTPLDDYPPTDYLERAVLQTRVCAAWNDTFLFFRLACDEPNMPEALAFRCPSIHFEHDFRAREDVQVHLDAPYLRDEVICLSVGIDGRLAERKIKPLSQRKNTQYEQNFNIRWDARVHYRPEGWLAFVKVPFAELGVSPLPGYEFGVNFTRNEFVLPEFTVWRGTGYWTVVPQTMGRLILAGSEAAPASSPTVILRQQGDGYRLDIAGEATEVLVNGHKAADGNEPFTLIEGADNSFSVVHRSGHKWHREIPVVPETHLLPVAKQSAPGKKELLRKFEELNELSENDYLGQGRYRNSGTTTQPKGLDTQINRPDLTAAAVHYRNSALRAEAFLCVNHIDPKPFYVDRARECLDWLLTEQRADGTMPSWGGHDPFAEQTSLVEHHNSDCFYENGNVGRAFLAGYQALGDPRYLAGAIRLAEFNTKEPPSHNTNYTAFCLYFQPELSARTGQQKYIQDAMHKYRTSVRVGQLLNGEWTAHNRHTCYMSIIGNGMASLARWLPGDSHLKPELRRRLTRLLNCFIRRMDPVCGMTHPHPADRSYGTHGAILPAVEAAEAFDLDLADFLHRLVNWFLQTPAEQLARSTTSDMLALARYLRWRFGD